MKKTIYSTDLNTITLWLKSKRLELGLTMRELGALLNKPHSFVQKVEQGERRLDIVEYVNYCGVLKLNPVDGIKLIQKNTKHQSWC
jgi:hypothetical protein